MSKKTILIFFIPVLLLLGGYWAWQTIWQQHGNDNKQEQLVSSQETAAQANTTPSDKGSKTSVKEEQAPPKNSASAPASTLASKNKLPVAKNDSAGQPSPLDLSRLFVEKLQQVVKKSSNGLYLLTVGDLDINLLASTVSLHQVGLRPDKQAVQRLKAAGLLPASVLTASFDDLLIEGINVDDAINSKSMDYKLVKLVNPQVTIEQYPTEKKESGGGNFSQRFLEQMEKLAIDKLAVEGGTITLQNKSNGSTKKLANVQVLMENILLNDATRNDPNRFLFAKEAQLRFHDFKTTTADGVYQFAIADALVNATQKTVQLKNVTYGSPLSKEAFQARQDKAKEKYDISLPAVSITGIDWWSALNGKAIEAGNVQTKGGKLDVYLDRSLPPQEKTGNFPNQLLHNLKTTVDVNKLAIEDFDLSYEEFNPKSSQSGTLYFSDLSLQVENVTNKEKNDKPVVVDGSAMFMKEIPMKASFTLSMDKAEEGAFTAQIKLDSFDAAAINPAAKPLGLVKVQRGQVYSIDVSMKGNEEGASGDVVMLYDKLKLALLKKGKDGEELRKRHLKTFLANWFVIKNDNPWWLFGNKRKKEAQFTRNPEAGFLNLVWKTAFVGILKTLGAPKKIATKK